jgi:phosphoribosylamine--glycine ligase
MEENGPLIAAPTSNIRNLIMKILVVGGGGREHALVWKLKQSSRAPQIFCAPGNAGTAGIATNLPIKATDIKSLQCFALAEGIDLTVVGPEKPLSLGIVDLFRKARLKIFGPTAEAAKLESSKRLSKKFMVKNGIPTAKHASFDDYTRALAYIRTPGKCPCYIKASGLADGKGAKPAPTQADAERILNEMMVGGSHKEAGREVVIEEVLTGGELSVHALCTENEFKLFPFFQDHKTIGEGDAGELTGGMGVAGPVPRSGAFISSIESIVGKTLRGMSIAETAFSGLLFPGIIMTGSGPKVLEFNCRFGDPETQAFVMQLESDLVDLLEAAASNRLNQVKLTWRAGFTVCIVIASGGYPNGYQTGYPISGLDQAKALSNEVQIFHAGTAIDEHNQIVTADGRVLGVTAHASTLGQARAVAYRAANLIKFRDSYLRKDIGLKLLRSF